MSLLGSLYSIRKDSIFEMDITWIPDRLTRDMPLCVSQRDTDLIRPLDPGTGGNNPTLSRWMIAASELSDVKFATVSVQRSSI